MKHVFDDRHIRPALHGPRRTLLMDGVTWTVYETRYSLESKRPGLSLIFESAAVIRRVKDYSATWGDLSDADLAQLSWCT
ncbi:MAG: hypothetical protein ABJF01_05600 [bacterium]